MANWEYQEWPFYNLAHLGTAQAEVWWQQCYVETPALRAFLDVSGSAILFGPAGSGKTIAINALARRLTGQALLLHYEPQYWPSGERPNYKGGDHLNQMMALAAVAVQQQMLEHPARFWQLDELEQEFLFWLIEKYLGRRSLHRISRHVSDSTDRPLSLPPPAGDLYPLSDPSPLDVRGQIDDLVSLANGLGLEQVVLLVDLDLFSLEKLQEDLAALLGWLDLLEHPAFHIRATLPESDDLRAQVGVWSSGRLRLLRLHVGEEEVSQIVGRCLAAATGGVVQAVDDIVGLQNVAVMRQEIEQVYGYEAPAGWCNWLQRLLAYTANNGPPTLEELRFLFYTHESMRLRLATHRPGVWRGPQLLSLDGKPLELFSLLYQGRGTSDYDELLGLAFTPENLNTMISRIRKAIEPIRGQHIYLQSGHKMYWLENTLFV